jgi:hypothetical protein
MNVSELILESVEASNAPHVLHSGPNQQEVASELLASKQCKQIHLFDREHSRIFKTALRYSHVVQVHCWTGDLAARMSRIFHTLHEPAVVWIGDTTRIQDQLDTFFVFEHADDSVLFIENAAKAEDELRGTILEALPDWEVTIEEGLLRAKSR